MKTQPNFAVRNLLIAILFTCLPLAGLSAKDEVWTLSEFVTASGFDKLLTSVHRTMRKASESPEIAQAAEAAKLKEAWGEAVDATFDQRQLPDAFIQHLTGKMTSKELLGIQRFLETDLGRRITQLGSEILEMELPEIIEKGAEVAKRASPTRAGMIKEMIEQIGGVETSLTIAMSSAFAMLKGMQADGAIPLQLPDEQLFELLKKGEPEMRKQMGAHLALTLAYTYRDVSDENLATYIAFLNSDEGKAMNKTTLSALKAVLNESMGQFGSKLMTLMGHEKS